MFPSLPARVSLRWRREGLKKDFPDPSAPPYCFSGLVLIFHSALGAVVALTVLTSPINKTFPLLPSSLDWGREKLENEAKL
jgi:hypothetical protein